MTTRQLVVTFAFVALTQLTLLGVIVFLDEPQRVGGPPVHVHAIALAYLLLPALLAAAAAYAPLRWFAQQRRRARR